MTLSWQKRATTHGGVGGFIMLLILLIGLISLYSFVINPDLGEKLTGQRFLKKPEPFVVVQQEPEKVLDLSVVAQHRDTWPAKVRMQKDHTFTLTLNGKEAGSIEVYAGQQVNLVDISPTQLAVRFEAATAIVPPEDTDLIRQLNESAWEYANRPLPTAAAPPPEVDAGPGKKPMRSTTSGAMPQVESEIRAVIGSGADILYKGWSDPKEVTFEGKLHWEITVTAGVIMPGKSRLGRIDHLVKVYMRDNKVTKVIDGGTNGVATSP